MIATFAGINRFARNPFVAFTSLAIAMAVYAYIGDRLNEQAGYCIEARIDLASRESAIRSSQIYALNLRIYEQTIAAGKIISPDQLDKIRRDVSGVENDLRSNSVTIADVRKELFVLCNEISSDRRRAYITYLLVSTFFAIYGLWASVQLSRKDDNA